MATASSLHAARKAVIAALTTSTGKPRALPQTLLFRSGLADVDAERAIRTKKSGTTNSGARCFVLVRDPSPEQESALAKSPIIRLSVTVQVTAYYYAGSELFRAETDAALMRIEDHLLAVPAALCEPGVLVTDPDGNPTGLDGDSLRGELWTATGPAPLPVREGEKTRVLKVDWLFRNLIELTRPT